jgi:LSD1 subclass zinc finger protein
MYLIKNCPSCQRPLRFPIDRGTIKVRCKCGYDFTADPDDSRLYDNARFDVAYRKNTKKNAKREKDFSTIYTDTKRKVITSILNAKYTIQNFKLLPAKQQQRVVLAGLIILAIIILAGFFICSYPAYTPMPPQDIQYDSLRK